MAAQREQKAQQKKGERPRKYWRVLHNFSDSKEKYALHNFPGNHSLSSGSLRWHAESFWSKVISAEHGTSTCGIRTETPVSPRPVALPWPRKVQTFSPTKWSSPKNLKPRNSGSELPILRSKASSCRKSDVKKAAQHSGHSQAVPECPGTPQKSRHFARHFDSVPVIYFNEESYALGHLFARYCEDSRCLPGVNLD